MALHVYLISYLRKISRAQTKLTSLNESLFNVCFLCQILWVSALLSIFIGLSQMKIGWHNSAQKQLNSKVVFVTMTITP